MREYIQQEVQNRQAFGRLTVIVRMLKNMRLRKDLKTLLRFNDYQLRDIGLSRHELCRMLDLPPACDLSFELERANAERAARFLEERTEAPAERLESTGLFARGDVTA